MAILNLKNIINSNEVTLENIKTDDFNKKYFELAAALDLLAAVKKNIDGALKDVMLPEYEETGVQTIQTKLGKITIVPPTIKETFDSKTFKENNPEMYKQYIKVSNVSACIRSTYNAATAQISKMEGKK